jgi:ParB/RepB/Spo0J family partition protein
MGRNNNDFHDGVVHVPMSKVEKFIPSDFHDDDWDNPIRMKHIDSETFANSDEEHPERYAELLKSVRKHGVKTPIQVRRIEDGEHFLEEGHHRVVAAREAGLKTIPVEFYND